MKLRFNLILTILFLTKISFAQFGFDSDLVSMKSFLSFEKAHAGSEIKFALRINIEDTWHINSNKPHDDFLIPTTVTFEPNVNFEVIKIFYPHAEDIQLAFSDNPVSVYEGEVYIGGILKISEKASASTFNLILNFEYQACNDNTCLAPKKLTDTLTINIVDIQTPVNEINQEIFEKIDLSYTPIINSNDDDLGNILESSGLLLGLLIVFIGGLALNLTPCVYPLIPITVGYFGGQTEGSTGKLFLMGTIYVLGMALTYSVVGVITALSGAVFGALLQNSLVIIIIAAILVTLSLSMFGVYEFRLPAFITQKAGGAKGGLFGAFLMGLTMGIVAAPCIGPFVISLVTIVAAKGNPLYGFIMFFVLALGLGTPFLFLSVFSGSINKLPRAGIWMEGVKHIFGVILLGMAVYFLLPMFPKTISGYALPAFMILGALYLFFDKTGNKINGYKKFKTAFSVLIIVVSVYFLIPDNKKSVEWEMFSEELYTQSVTNNSKIIIDFYADWCIPCKELDALTFTDPRVIEESKKFSTFKADMTKSLSPDVETMREKFNIVGVPTVLIIDSNGNEAGRITGFVNADEFLKIISNIN